MQKNQITFNHKAPYYKLGSINDQSRNIWMIFHGYGQLAEEFQDKFSVINQDENVLVFPQGLSKFYLKEIDKNIGASWMTAHDRDTDIENYLSYLNQVYDLEIEPYSKQLKFNILGFSQGVHTATRWIYRSGINYDKLILWGAGLAYEINKEIVSASFNKGKQCIALGDQDRFIDKGALDKIQSRYNSIGFDYQLIRYKGGHDIYPEVLKSLL